MRTAYRPGSHFQAGCRRIRRAESTRRRWIGRKALRCRLCPRNVRRRPVRPECNWSVDVQQTPRRSLRPLAPLRRTGGSSHQFRRRRADGRPRRPACRSGSRRRGDLRRARAGSRQRSRDRWKRSRPQAAHPASRFLSTRDRPSAYPRSAHAREALVLRYFQTQAAGRCRPDGLPRAILPRTRQFRRRAYRPGSRLPAGCSRPWRAAPTRLGSPRSAGTECLRTVRRTLPHRRSRCWASPATKPTAGHRWRF